MIRVPRSLIGAAALCAVFTPAALSSGAQAAPAAKSQPLPGSAVRL